MMQEQGRSSNSKPETFSQFSIDGQRWTIRTTRLRIRCNGQWHASIVNTADRNILVDVSASGEEIAEAVAKAVALVADKQRRRHPRRFIKLPPPMPTPIDIAPDAPEVITTAAGDFQIRRDDALASDGKPIGFVIDYRACLIRLNGSLCSAAQSKALTCALARIAATKGGR